MSSLAPFPLGKCICDRLKKNGTGLNAQCLQLVDLMAQICFRKQRATNQSKVVLSAHLDPAIKNPYSDQLLQGDTVSQGVAENQCKGAMKVLMSCFFCSTVKVWVPY